MSRYGYLASMVLLFISAYMDSMTIAVIYYTINSFLHHTYVYSNA